MFVILIFEMLNCECVKQALQRMELLFVGDMLNIWAVKSSITSLLVYVRRGKKHLLGLWWTEADRTKNRKVDFS